MTEQAISTAVFDYLEAVLPAGTPLSQMDADPVRYAAPHVSGMLTDAAPVSVPEPAYDTTTRALDSGSRQMLDVAFLVEAYGPSAVDWLGRVRGCWLTRGGPAATLRAAGVQTRAVDTVREVSAFVDTGTEPRAQCILRAYVAWTSPDDLDLSAGYTEAVDIALDLGDVTAVVRVDDVFLATDDGTSLDLDDGEPLLLEL
jgi:hypothetical protein